MTQKPRWLAGLFRLVEGLIAPRTTPPVEPSSRRPEPKSVDVGPSTAILAPHPPVIADARAEEVEVAKPPSEVTAAPSKQVGVDASPLQTVETAPVQDDESRRKLIRRLFNEYWDGIEDKPSTFAERLQVAEAYINDRLAEQNVEWRLDAATRQQLGLPSYGGSARSLRT